MGNRKATPDELIEAEIERLSKLPEVKLARRERTLKNRRRAVMNDLRYLEKRGKELIAMGIDAEVLELMYQYPPEEE